jgi:hypothetical protein
MKPQTVTCTTSHASFLMGSSQRTVPGSNKHDSQLTFMSTQAPFTSEKRLKEQRYVEPRLGARCSKRSWLSAETTSMPRLFSAAANTAEGMPPERGIADEQLVACT